MKALMYLIRTSIINYLKRIKEKPQRSIGLIFTLIWVGILLFPRSNAHNDKVPTTIPVSIFVLLTLVTFLFSLYSGTKKVKSKFDMSDVNLIFVSPIKPQTIMLYGIVKKIALEFFASLYILLQMINFIKDLNVTILAQILFFISYIIFQLIFCNCLKLFIFAICSKYKKVGFIIRSSIKAFILILTATIGIIVLKGNIQNFIETFVDILTYNIYIKYIPILGWMKEIALQTITGIKASYFIYMALVIALSSVLIYITYNIKLDFYEDMLSSAELNENIKNIKSGKASLTNNKKSFILKPFKFKNSILNLKGKYGSKVILFKHINEYSKRSFIFFINTYSLILLLISVLTGIFAKNLDIKILFIGSIALLFFTSGLGGKIYNEINHPFIFLLPDNPQKKLFYGISSSLIKIFSDAVIIFVCFGILGKKSILEILLCIICYTAWGGMLSYSGLFAFRIAHALGFTGQTAKGIIFMIFQLLLVVPMILIIIMFAFLFKDLSSYAIYFAFLLYSISASALISFGCIGIFNHMELE